MEVVVVSVRVVVGVEGWGSGKSSGRGMGRGRSSGRSKGGGDKYVMFQNLSG